jgi:hypothetical protein
MMYDDRSYKNILVLLRLYVFCKMYNKVAVWSLYLVFGFMGITKELLKLGILKLEETDHNSIYKFCMKYCLQVNNYRHDNVMKLRLCLTNLT